MYQEQTIKISGLPASQIRLKYTLGKMKSNLKTNLGSIKGKIKGKLDGKPEA